MFKIDEFGNFLKVGCDASELISLELLLRKLEMLTQAAQVGIRKNVDLINFCASATRIQPEFRLMVIAESLWRGHMPVTLGGMVQGGPRIQECLS